MEITKEQIALHQFASKDAYKYALKTVRTNGRVAVATDSFRLVEVTNTNRQADAEYVQIEAAPLKSVKPVKGLDVMVTQKDGVAEVFTGTTTHKIPTKTEPYPEYAHILPDTTKPLASIRINAKMLEEILEYMGQFKGKSGGYTVDINIHGSMIEILADNSGQSARAVQMMSNK